jgi:hypothetical protein
MADSILVIGRMASNMEKALISTKMRKSKKVITFI